MQINDPSEYNNFYKSLKFVLAKEGGYVNDPDDPGGETKWGISKRYHPNEDIRNLTPERCAEIYFGDYWVPASCNALGWPSCLVVFDTAVNMGVGVAKSFLKESGGETDAYLNLRKQRYVDLVKANPKKQKFLAGWLNRIADVQKAMLLD